MSSFTSYKENQPPVQICELIEDYHVMEEKEVGISAQCDVQ